MVLRTSYITDYADRIRSYIARQNPYRVAAFGLAIIILITGAIWAIAALYGRHAAEAYDTALLAALWSSYKQQDWDKTNGRTIDTQSNNVTTSEGQAYTMLRAVWMNDRPTFNMTWQWTAAHLQRSDSLFSWRYGTRSDGTAGILTNEGGENSASDADVDIATALLMAGAKWHSTQYRNTATTIVQAIWSHEIIRVQDHLYLAADNLEKSASTPTFIVNPSYLAPYAFRLFSKLDPQHDWNGLASDAYTFLGKVDTRPLGSTRAAGLPPDWVAVDRQTGALLPSTNPAQSTDFGYNAFRVLWRVGLDWQWSRTPAAQQTFQSYNILNSDWKRHHMLAAAYHHDGQPAVAYESLALYGGVLGYFNITDSSIADSIVQSKIAPSYDSGRQQLVRPLGYYDNNWVWFGLALYDNQLPDLSGYGGST